MILASNNAHKLTEIRAILADLGIDLISQREAGCDFEVEETGTTFEENAYLKAAAVTKATGEPAIADDSGLEVDALGGEPGVHSARYTGNHEDSDEDRNNLVLKKLGDLPLEKAHRALRLRHLLHLPERGRAARPRHDRGPHPLRPARGKRLRLRSALPARRL